MARSPLSLDARIREVWNEQGLAAGLSDNHVKGLHPSLIDQISRIRDGAPNVDATTAPGLAGDIVDVFISCYNTPLAELGSD